MYVSQNRIKLYASEHFNPMHGLEKPEDATSFLEPPVLSTNISSGQTKPKGLDFRDGSSGIAKTDPHSMANEQAAYEIGHRLSLPIPKTVRRQYPDFKTKIITPQTVQQRVGGRDVGDTNDDENYSNNLLDIQNHPDWSKMAIGDWLIGNHDRHDENMKWQHNRLSPNGRLHLIDNGEAFNYHHHDLPYRINNGNLSLESNNFNVGNLSNNFIDGWENNIPDDLRQSIMNANPEEHAAILDKIYGHSSFQSPNAIAHARNKYGAGPNSVNYYGNMAPEDIKEYIKNGYIRRLQTLKNHLSDPSIRTLGNLYPKIFH